MAFLKQNGAALEQRENVAEALARWKAAMAFYENVSDPDLMEFAIYDMEASRRKYVFLLKRSKKK